MTDEVKKVKVQFDPAFFEIFEGTQEELDSMMSEITSLFEGKSIEEIKAMSNTVEWDDLDEFEQLALARATSGDKPTLQ